MNRESIKKYKKNLKFFKKEHPEIYDLIKNSSNENIEIVQHNGKMNIKTGDKWYYPDNYLDSLDKKIDDFLNSEIESFNLIPDKPPKYYNKPLHEKYLKKITQDFQNIKNIKEKALVKDKESLFYLIIYGIGLGFHIEKILEKIKVKNLFLIEENIDFFIASLYAVDWENIYKKSNVTIVLGDDISKQVLGIVSKIHQINEVFSYRIFVYVHYQKNFFKFRKELKNFIYEENSKWGFFDDEFESIKNTLINIKNRVPIYIGKHKIEKDLPLFVVASGPSLEYSIEIIRKYQDRAVIFSCGTALRPLLKNSLKPDFEIVIERMKHTYDSLLDNASKEELKNINIIGVNPMYPDVFNLGRNNYMVPRYPDSGANLFFEYYNLPKLRYMTPTVTNMALALGLHLGFKKVYLFGTDMGFADRRKHHVKDSIYYKDKSEFKTNEMDVYKEVEGNFTDRVYTTKIFEMTRKSLESLIKLYPDVKIFNTANGAKIDGTIPLKMKIEDLKIEYNAKKSDALESIKQNFTEDLYNKNFNKFIEKRLKDIFLKIDNLKNFIQDNIKIENFSEKEHENGLYLLYDKFEKEIFRNDEMFYVLFRGTLYHIMSFYYLHFTSLNSAKKQIILANNFKQDLLNFLDESKKRLKKFYDLPIMKM